MVRKAAMTAPVTNIKEVLARLEAIEAELPSSDGVKWFNRLYLEMTQQVDAVPPQHQDAPPFLEKLDVVFANRYLAAYDTAGTDALPAGYPFHAWSERRTRSAIRPAVGSAISSRMSAADGSKKSARKQGRTSCGKRSGAVWHSATSTTTAM